ncbi:hypothetical protein H6F46_01425 [Limnothrix sp. FACHB-1083]|uniref:hypothetical protein n=1 Tax=unclassified Limnothrix TaxID=2632864 RepID=UPI001681133B|nr:MULTISPECIES: hypothetical protein [unclassified Limnothrix]MBD2159345.1 hypothetical protein [Limnothrix sp. FACHB-1083]MBD2193158.1 hypothetical protein [Limnothrix sp. FACHB-1088]
MSDYQERRRLIRENLKIQPVNHGQVHTCLVGMRSQPEISPDRYEELRWSLRNHNSNLIPILVRRTDQLGDEVEYEVIHGADWVVVANDLDIGMLWAWVFDLSDAEAALAQEELAVLLEGDPPSASIANPDPSPQPVVEPGIDPTLGQRLEEQLTQRLEQLLDQKLTQSLAGVTVADRQALGDANSAQTLATLESQMTDLSQQLANLSQTGNPIAQPQPPSPTSETSSSSAAQEIVASLERSIHRLCEVVTEGSKITLTIEPPAKSPAPVVDPQEAELRKIYSVVALAKLKTLAKDKGIAISSKAKAEEIIEALIESHRLSVAP